MNAKLIRKLIAIITIICIFASLNLVNVFAEENMVEITSKSAILMEASTGTIIQEKNADEKLRPASITKIMTLILIFDALKSGKIHLDDVVTTSEYASSMGGSQVFLEVGEQQSVDTLIKCISVASANDACVVMAEYISGSEKAFVEEMNKRAAGLSMTNTLFNNCCGLDTDNHYSTARDVAIMSKELITKYPEIFNYSTIWMENIIHKTDKGESEFGLANTNKLIRQYEYATGLKTGSTSLAKYCVSATARKDDVDMIAVIMAAPDYKVRFREAAALLNYGFGSCRMYKDSEIPKLEDAKIKNGIDEKCPLMYEDDFKYLDMEKSDFSNIKKKVVLNEKHDAPVEAGQIAGYIIYSLGDKEIGRTAILYKKSVRKVKYTDCLKKSFLRLASI